MNPRRRGPLSNHVRHSAAWSALCLSALAAIAATASATAVASRGEPLHVALRSSTPAANDTLMTAPHLIRLDFTQAIEVALARIELSGADSVSIALAPVRAVDATDRAIVTDVPSTLGAGTYRVHWTVTSRDSHTIRGDFLFTVLAPAVDTTVVAAMDADTVPATAPGTTADLGSSPEFDARSPGYAAIRGLTYVAILGIVGALFFGVGVIPSVQRRIVPADAATRPALERAIARARVGAIGAGTVLLLASALRLLAQVRAVFGELTLDAATISPLLTGTAWGRGWIAQVCAAAVALGLVARRPTRPRGDGRVGPIEIIGGLVLLTLVVSAAVSGHAVTASPASLAVASDAVHLLAVGGWLGTLAYVAFAGIPATNAAEPDSRARLARDIVTTFSKLALVCVAAILATGIVSAWLELRSLSALWTSPYGRVLMVKLALVALVAAAGAYNWRVATPRLATAGGVTHIRTVMIVELLFAVLVLGATVLLTATPPPIDMRLG